MDEGPTITLWSRDAEGNPRRVPVPRGSTLEKTLALITSAAIGHTVVRITDDKGEELPLPVLDQKGTA